MTNLQGQDNASSIVQKVPITCPHDCGGQCLMWAHVKDGVIVRIESEPGDEPPARACARGLASRKRVYAPDRIKYTMKRVGERGEGKFERISWDEALDKIAAEMKRIKAQYGPGAFVNLQYAGEPLGSFQGIAVGRLMNMFGGNVQHWGGASLEGKYWAALATFGDRWAALGSGDARSARLLILWGRNPAITRGGNNPEGDSNPFFLSQAKEAGTRIVCIDPRYTETVALYADQWVPIIPGTDTAMLIAMAYVIINENLQDQKFLDEYTVGFDKFKEYVLGKEDGIPKTPAWAEVITSVPAATITGLAREYATTKTAMLIDGWGPGRTAYGEQYFRAAYTLKAMTSNISPSEMTVRARPFRGAGYLFSKGKNPFDFDPQAPADVGQSLDPALKNRRRVVQGNLYDAMMRGKDGGYPSDIKMAWVNGGNTLNQFANTNKGVKAFKQLDFIVVTEQFMTPTAKFADILLPATTHLERSGVYTGGGRLFYSEKAIEPLFEAKSDFQICAALAPRLGIENYDGGKTEEELLKDYLTSPDMKKWITDYDAFKKRGVWEWSASQPQAGKVVLPTSSGKIEIYSQKVADLKNPEIPPIPKYMETWENRNDPLTKKYPLQLITSHFRLRAHSVFDNVAWLKDLEPQRVWVNTADARSRGIQDGDLVRVFNDRGVVLIPAYVTERIMPGVVNLCEGAWYNPDKDGVDRGGCPNVLTKDKNSPAGAWCTHTSLVQVVKV